MVHESGLPLLPAVHELVAAQGRWRDAAARHGAAVDCGDPEDWRLLQELTVLPPTFPPLLRSLIARSIIRRDVLAARSSFTAYARQHRDGALAARRLLDQCAPTLSSLYGAELTPTRPMGVARTAVVPSTQLAAPWGWAALGLLVLGGTAALLIARPSAALEQHSAVSRICQVVGAEHPSCLSAGAAATGVDQADCALAKQALPLLEDQLKSFGLNRELAVIRSDELGELRAPFDELSASYAIRCE